MSNMSGLLGFIIFIVICVLSSSANKKNKGGAKNTADKPAAPTPASMPKRPTVNIPKRPAAPARSAEPERKYYDSTCMEADTRHDHDRRLEQLDNFLKSGIIDKEEYKILLAKYQRYS